MMIYLAEFLGSFFLVGTVVGSGIMGERLSPDNMAVALLGNTRDLFLNNIKELKINLEKGNLK